MAGLAAKMSNDAPDFYLETAGDGPLDEPRACWIMATPEVPPDATDNLLVRIEPSLIGQPYGLGAQDIGALLLTRRWVGTRLCPVNEWPMGVRVWRILDESALKANHFEANQIEMIGWGFMHREYEEAERFCEQTRGANS